MINGPRLCEMDLLKKNWQKTYANAAPTLRDFGELPVYFFKIKFTIIITDKNGVTFQSKEKCND